MSIWTHVIGGIRLDSFSFRPVENKLKKIFIESTFHNWNEKCNMPCGSEGSIRYKIIYNEDESCLNVCQIAFWGDLRDYDSQRVKEEFKSWLESVKKKLNRASFLIRQINLSVECEDGLVALYGIDEYDGKIVEKIIKEEDNGGNN